MADTKEATKQQQQQSKDKGGEKSSPAAPDLGRVTAGLDLQAADQYLASKGWEKVSGDEYGRAIWRDPMGAGSLRVEYQETKLPLREGGEETIRQAVLPVADWRHPTWRAVKIQLSRDVASGEKSPSPLEKLDNLGKKYDELAHRFDTLKGKVTIALRRSIPDKPDNMKSELLWLKNFLAELLTEVSV